MDKQASWCERKLSPPILHSVKCWPLDCHYMLLCFILSWLQQLHQSFFSTDQYWNAEQTNTSTGAKLMSDVFIWLLQMQLFVVCKSHSSSSNACMHSRRIRVCLLCPSVSTQRVYRDYLFYCGHLSNAQILNIASCQCARHSVKQTTVHMSQMQKYHARPIFSYWVILLCISHNTTIISHLILPDDTLPEQEFGCTRKRTRNCEHCLSFLTGWVKTSWNCCYLVTFSTSHVFAKSSWVLRTINPHHKGQIKILCS